MRTRSRVAAGVLVLVLATFAAVRFAGVGSRTRPDAVPAAVPPAWDAARWQPGAAVADVELLALDGRTPARLLGRGANRPLIVIVATPGSPALDRCAWRWRELFEIYKDRVEFLTVFVAPPDSGGADTTARVRPDAGAATDPQAELAVGQRVDAAITFVTCNDWRIPVLVDGLGGAAGAQFGTAPHLAVILDEERRRLGAPVAAEVATDLDAVYAWLRHRPAP